MPCTRGGHMKTLLTAVIGFAALMTTASIRATEIKVIASNGVKEALHELAPAFERETGHKLVVSFGLATALKRQIEAGETFRHGIHPPPATPHLANYGHHPPPTPPPAPPPSVDVG